MSRSSPNRSAGDVDKRGSVLIFVVGVLLLLAIIATAFLGTSRSDRTSTQQNAYNTQIDLLLESVVNAVKGEVLADMRNQSGANNYDALGDDGFLGARLPIVPDPTAVASAGNPPIWTSITAPLLDTVFANPFKIAGTPGSYSNPKYLFPRPTSVNVNGQTYPGFVLNATALNNTYPTNAYAGTAYVVPAADTDQDGIADAGLVKMPIGPIAGVTYYYAARVIDLGSALNLNTAWVANDPTNPGTVYRLDANYFPTNIDLVNLLAGLTPTATSDQTMQMDALNLYRRNGVATFNLTPVDDNGNNRPDFTFAGTNLNSADALWQQLGRRTENPGRINTTKSYKAFDINTSTDLASKFVLAPVGGSGDLYTDLKYSLAAAPGGFAKTAIYSAANAVNWFNDNFYFQDGTGATNPIVPQLPLRALLTATNPSGTDDAKSVAQSVKATGKVDTWLIGNEYSFGDVVSFKLGTGTKAVDRNFVCINTHTAAAANQPDTVVGVQYWSMLSWSDLSQKVPVNTADFGELWWGFRRLMAATLVVDKTNYAHRNLSTAPFPTPSNVPVDSASATTATFYDFMNGSAAVGQNYTAGDRARMFRTVVRDPAMTGQFPSPPASSRSMSPSAMLQLRTAIAAVNTIDLRDNDSNITARRAIIYDYGTAAPPPNTPPATPVATYDVTVFGSEMQPYITEVYVNNDSATAVPNGPNQYGYVAIELFNPYPVEINLAGWSLGLIDRSTTTYPRRIVPILEGPGYLSQRFLLTDNIIIPAGGRLILENYHEPGETAVSDAADAAHRPTEVVLPVTAANVNTITATNPAVANGVYYKFVSKLGRVLQGYNGAGTGGELVLVRPRQWSPSGAYTLTNSSTFGFADQYQDPHCEFDPADATTNTVNLADWVPVDSMDFSGMVTAPNTDATFKAWRYCRAGDPTNTATAWKWTHGGPYINSAVGTLHQGVACSTAFLPGTAPAAGTFSPLTTSAPQFGLAKAEASWVGTDLLPGTQINNVDWPSPNYASVTTGNRTPFGTFAQQTDLFKIPYIGAYTLRKYNTTSMPAEYAPPGQLPSASPAPGFTEMNALPLDHGFADDEDAANNAIEQVGRFCPLSTLDPYAYRNWNPSSGSPWTGAPASRPDWYDFSWFATRDTRVPRTIFDVFTVTSPLDDSLPDVSFDEYQNAIALPNYSMPGTIRNALATKLPASTYTVVTAISGPGTDVTPSANLKTPLTDYVGAAVQIISGPARGSFAFIQSETSGVFTLSVAPPGLAIGDAFRIIGAPEDAVGTQGLININTAPWPVLARLPFALKANGTVDFAASESIAKRIVTYRDGNPAGANENERAAHGPFQSIMDLNRVLSVAGGNNAGGTDAAYFQSVVGAVTVTNDYWGVQFGDITPLPGSAGAVADNVAGDFENRYLALSRISNLITTRSDAFVMYVVLQGWKDAGTANAKMVTQRNAAFILDRSGSTASAPQVKATRVPTN